MKFIEKCAEYAIKSARTFLTYDCKRMSFDGIRQFIQGMKDLKFY